MMPPQPPTASRLDLAQESVTDSSKVDIIRQQESYRLTVWMRVANLLHIRGTLSEDGSRTSWIGSFFIVVMLALGAIFIASRVVLTSSSSDLVRILVSAVFGGTVLAVGVCFLLHRSKRH